MHSASIAKCIMVVCSNISSDSVMLAGDSLSTCFEGLIEIRHEAGDQKRK